MYDQRLFLKGLRRWKNGGIGSLIEEVFNENTKF